MAYPLTSMIGSAALTLGLALFASAGETRFADGPPPCTGPSPIFGADPRSLLMESAFGKMAVCRTHRDDDGSVVAAWEIEGEPLGRALSDPRVIAASWTWR